MENASKPVLHFVRQNCYRDDFTILKKGMYMKEIKVSNRKKASGELDRNYITSKKTLRLFYRRKAV